MEFGGKKRASRIFRLRKTDVLIRTLIRRGQRYQILSKNGENCNKNMFFLKDNFFVCGGGYRRDPLQPISGPRSIEKSPSSSMLDRYTRIFDAG